MRKTCRIFIVLLIVSVMLSGCLKNKTAYEVFKEDLNRQNEYELHYNFPNIAVNLPSGDNNVDYFEITLSNNYIIDYETPINRVFKTHFIEKFGEEKLPVLEEHCKALFKDYFNEFLALFNSFEVEPIEPLEKYGHEVTRITLPLENMKVVGIHDDATLIVYEYEGKDIVKEEYYKLLNYDELEAYYIEFDTNYPSKDFEGGYCNSFATTKLN